MKPFTYSVQLIDGWHNGCIYARTEKQAIKMIANLHYANAEDIYLH